MCVKMKAGDIVKLCVQAYPQYKGKSGILVSCIPAADGTNSWKVFVGGRIHPYHVDADNLVEIK